MGPDQVRWVGFHLLRRPVLYSAPAPSELLKFTSWTFGKQLPVGPSRLSWPLLPFGQDRALLGRLHAAALPELKRRLSLRRAAGSAVAWSWQRFISAIR